MSFLIHKAVHLEDVLLQKTPQTQGNFYITEKFNGWWVKIPHDGTCWQDVQSATFRDIPALAYHHENLQRCKWSLPKHPFYLIAEVIIPGIPFEKANGIFNRKRESAERHKPVFMLHDLVVPSLELTADERLVLLNTFVRNNYRNFTDALSMYKAELLFSNAISYNEVIWKNMFESIVTRGGEGIVAKRATSLYLPGKRTSDLIKLKIETQLDCRIVGFEETTGDKGNPGFIMYVERASGVVLPVAIGKHTDRAMFKANPEFYMGKIATINAMSEFKETGMLQQPVYSGIIRDDKFTPD